MKKLARWTEQLLIGAGDRPESAATGEERARPRALPWRLSGGSSPVWCCWWCPVECVCAEGVVSTCFDPGP